MAEESGTEVFSRREALMAVATLSVHDPEFLRGIRTSRELTLWRYGFALSPQEMQEVDEYFANVNSAEFSDEKIVEDLQDPGSRAERRW